MDRLHTELQRLYLADGHRLLTPEGHTRALVLELAQPPDWTALAAVWAFVQDDLELPAPALAVSGGDGGQLWFAVGTAVPARAAHDFLNGLVQRCLPGWPPARVRCWPSLGEPSTAARHTPPVPDQIAATGHWSAFVAPGLASLFGDTPWLDTPPSPDAQADLLARLRPMPLAEFEQARQRLAPTLAAPVDAPPPAPTGAPLAPAPVGHAPLTPQQFLLAVMNDPSVPLPLRLDAAKALLPHGPAQA